MKPVIFFLGAFGWMSLWLAITLFLEHRGVEGNALYWTLGAITVLGGAAWIIALSK